MNNNPTSYNFIIAGGGSAGCVLASRLSENPKHNILLMEAGQSYEPGNYPAELLDGNSIAIEPSHIWGYQSIPLHPEHSVAAFAGKVLGGGSTINAGIARRARKSDWDKWLKRGLKEWSFEETLEAYRSLEKTDAGEDRWHGRYGLWPVHQSTMEELTPPVRAFIEAAVSTGFAYIKDFNGENQNGVGPEVKNVENGVRFNTGTIYLSSEVRTLTNLTITECTIVDKVIFKKKQAIGIQLTDGEIIHAGEIILSPGVYGSAAILLRSGVGPAAHLKTLGIAMVADLPVGEKFQDQPMYSVTCILKPNAGDEPAHGSGTLWTRSSEAIDDELDLQLSISVQPDFDNAGNRIKLLRIWAAVVVPQSTGTIMLKNKNALVTPRINYNLLSKPADRRKLREIIKIARNILQTEPVASLIEQELFPGSTVTTDEDLDNAIDAGLITFYHGTSSAPMGSNNDATAVTDSRGNVRQVSGLRVVDASIFPEAISTPTNLTTIMVAERIASFINSKSKIQ